MNDILRPVLGKSVLVYLDDIVIFSKNHEQNKEHLSNVLQLLSAAGLQLNLSKCHFGQTSIDLLGHTIDHDGIHPQVHKLKAIADM